MSFFKTVRLFYLVYTIYTCLILLISDYPVRYAIVGLCAMWGIYFLMSIGYGNSMNIYRKMGDKKVQKLIPIRIPERLFFMDSIAGWKRYQYLINAAICWGCTILASRYYTGKGISEVFRGFLGNNDAYYAYQAYFKDTGIATFSMEKIPYILMLTYLTMSLFWSFVAINRKKKIRPFQYFYLGLIAFAYLYFGTARGTNFETYIVFIVIAYCLLNRNTRKISMKSLIIVGLLGVLMVAVFRTVVGNRGNAASTMLCAEIRYFPDQFPASVSPALTQAVVSVFSYLGYGIYEIGLVILRLVLRDLPSFLFSFFPLSGHVRGVTFVFEMKQIIELGARWAPDFLYLLDQAGFVFMGICYYLIGKIAAKCQAGHFHPLTADLIKIFLYVECLSLPVGNFLGTSTPNKLVTLIVVICAILRFGDDRPVRGEVK